MKRIAYVVLVLAAVALCGCDDKGDVKSVKHDDAAPASEPAGAAAVPPKADTPPRVGHRMQLDPVSSDKFKRGQQTAGAANQNGGK